MSNITNNVVLKMLHRSYQIIYVETTSQQIESNHFSFIFQMEYQKPADCACDLCITLHRLDTHHCLTPL